MCGAKAGRGVRYVLAAQAGEVPEEQDLMNHGEDQHSRPVWKYLAGSSVQRFAPCYLLGRLTSEVEQRESCCMPTFKLSWFPYFRILTQDPAEAKRHSHHLAGAVAACSKPMMKMLWFLPALCAPRWGNESPCRCLFLKGISQLDQDKPIQTQSKLPLQMLCTVLLNGKLRPHAKMGVCPSAGFRGCLNAQGATCSFFHST